jgi:uncharacterized membrane protein HdeD (DUF308 family)
MPTERVAGREGNEAAQLIRRSWWLLATRGLLAILLGIVALTRPGITFSFFVMLLGFYLAVDGLLTIVSSLYEARGGRTFWPYLFEGLISLAVGILGMARPTPLGMVLILLIAVRAFMVGIIEIGTGLSARRADRRSGALLGLAGVVSIAFAVLFIARPSAGVVVMAWTFGLYAIIFGLFMDFEAFRTRGARKLASEAG